MILRNISVVLTLLCICFKHISVVSSKTLENGFNSEHSGIAFEDANTEKDQNTAAEESVEHINYENTSVSNSTDALEGLTKEELENDALRLAQLN